MRSSSELGVRFSFDLLAQNRTWVPDRALVKGSGRALERLSAKQEWLYGRRVWEEGKFGVDADLLDHLWLILFRYFLFRITIDPTNDYLST